MSKPRYHKIVSRLDNHVAEHRCPDCGAHCTVDRSCTDTCVVECSDVFCDFVFIAHRVKGKWRGQRIEDAVIVPKRGNTWLLPGANDILFQGDD